jgi:hypothetical protein
MKTVTLNQGAQSMKKRGESSRVVVALAVLFLINYARASGPAITDADWTCMNEGGIAGTNGAINGIAYSKGSLYIAGNFSIAGTVFANKIAKWDGTKWNPLGTGMNGSIGALACDKAGNLFACGAFDSSNGVAMRHVAKWDGGAWRPLGNGLNKEAYAIAIDSSGIVYVGGAFDTAGSIDAKKIARWDGSAWSALGSGVTAGVTAIVCGKNGSLFVTGGFDTAGGIPAKRVAGWDGFAWDSLGGGIDGSVNAATLDKNGNLIVGGSFSKAGGVSVWMLAQWNGVSWSAYGDGISNDRLTYVYALVCDPFGNVYIGGRSAITIDYATPYTFLAVVGVGYGWNPIASGNPYAGPVTALACDDTGKIYVGGSFQEIGVGVYYNGPRTPGITANHITSWDGKGWGVFESKPMQGTANSVVCDEGGNVYLGGNFSSINGVKAHSVACWNGVGWNPLGAGINNVVSAFAVDSGGNLYSGGYFDTAGGIAVRNVAQWNGKTWNALGTGTGGLDPSVLALACDRQGNVFAGGNFQTAGGINASRIARWNGKTWDSLGSGLLLGDSPQAVALSLSFDVHGDLMVGGMFYSAGDVATSGVARWNNGTWASYGSSLLNSAVGTIAVDKSEDIFVANGCRYYNVFGIRGVLRWNGNGWSAVGLDSSVYSLVIDESGTLYAGGAFPYGHHLARWDGDTWSALGSGTDGPVTCLALHDSTLYVGGNFTVAGDKISPNIAKVTIHSQSNLVKSRLRTVIGTAPVIFLVNGYLRIRNVSPRPFRFEIFDLSGKLIVSRSVSDVSGCSETKLPKTAHAACVCRLISSQGISLSRIVMKCD